MERLWGECHRPTGQPHPNLLGTFLVLGREHRHPAPSGSKPHKTLVPSQIWERTQASRFPAHNADSYRFPPRSGKEPRCPGSQPRTAPTPSLHSLPIAGRELRCLGSQAPLLSPPSPYSPPIDGNSPPFPRIPCIPQNALSPAAYPESSDLPTAVTKHALQPPPAFVSPLLRMSFPGGGAITVGQHEGQLPLG